MSSVPGEALFIAVEVDEPVASDPVLAAKNVFVISRRGREREWKNPA